MNKQVFVIGLGLIGGSIALAIKKKHNVKIVGFDVNHDQLKVAKSLQVIDEMVDNLEDGAKDADLIIISAPVKQTEAIIEELSKYELKSDVIISDVGSTKKQIVEHANILIEKGITFIGGHPMAGSHKSGVSAAKAHLFENAFYILTPYDHTPENKLEVLKSWLEGTKANFIVLSPNEHDKIAGAISHFPHIVAAGLVHQVAHIEKENSLVSSLAAGGFRDITRIASGSPVMWRDILLHNRDALIQMIIKWQEEMDDVRLMIESLDSDGIYEYFLDAKKFRDRLPSRKRGALPAFYDLYVDVPDHPGVISDVTGILAQEKISITNIQIIEAREDILGVLRLSFQNEEDRHQAKGCLGNYNYETYILN